MIGAPKVKPYKRKLRRHGDAIINLYSPGGPQGGKLISGSADNNFRVWDLQKKRIKKKLQLNRPSPAELEKLRVEIEDVELSEEDEEKTLPSISPEIAEKLFPEEEKKSTAVSAACVFEKTLFAGYEDGIICKFNIRSTEEKAEAIFIGHNGRINCMLTTADGKLYSCSNDCSIRIWSISEATCECVYKLTYPISTITFLENDDSKIFAGLWDKSVQVIDLKEKKIAQSFQALHDSVKAITITPKWIFVAGADPVIRGWDHAAKKAKEYAGHQGWVYALKVYENLLFSGGDDKTVKVWDIESGTLLDELNGHENGVTALEIANEELFSGSYDHTIICWDIEEIKQQIEERNEMKEEEKLSKVMEEKMKGMKKGIAAKKGKSPPSKKGGKVVKKGKK